MSNEEILNYLDIGANVSVETLKNIVTHDFTNIWKNSSWLYHIRLGHASLSFSRTLSKTVDCLKGITFPDEILDCEVCKLAKIKRQRCSFSFSRSFKINSFRFNGTNYSRWLYRIWPIRC